MLKLLLPLIVISFCLSSFNSDRKKGVILAVFAHPDDEGAIAQLLVKYGKTHKVHLIIATDGRYGVRPGFPTGDTLIRLRETESECACKVLGIEQPIFLRYSDGLDTRNGVGKYLGQTRELKEELKKKLEEINPDLIITFGPDGDTGHADHRLISNLVTEIIMSNGWIDRFPLYYLGWTKKDDEKFKIIGGLNTVDQKYLNISIRFSEEDETQAMKAFDCYKSQILPGEIKQLVAVEKKDTTNMFRFWQLEMNKQRRSEF